MEWEKILVNHVSNQKLNAEYLQDFRNSTSPKQVHEKWGKDLDKDTSVQYTDTKSCGTPLLVRQMHVKTTAGQHTRLSGWLLSGNSRSKKIVTPHAVGRKANWRSHVENSVPASKKEKGRKKEREEGREGGRKEERTYDLATHFWVFTQKN